MLSYERLRILHCWYYLKALSEAFANQECGREKTSQLIQELDGMSINQIYVLWDLTVYLCATAPDKAVQQLGIRLFDNPEEMDCTEEYYETVSWARVQSVITEKFCQYRNKGHDAFEKKLNGAFEICFVHNQLGDCKIRDETLGLWELGE